MGAGVVVFPFPLPLPLGLDHFVSTIALIGIVIIVASLLSGVLERTAVPLVAVFLLLGAMLGPAGLNVLDVQLESPELRVLAILALTLVLFSDAVTLDTKEIRAQRKLALRVLGPGTFLPAAISGRKSKPRWSALTPRRLPQPKPAR